MVQRQLTTLTFCRTIALPLLNGGTGGAIFVYLGSVIGMFFVIVSMAEMASIAPTSGGQYHWVSEFAPREHQKFLSYLVGKFNQTPQPVPLLLRAMHSQTPCA